MLKLAGILFMALIIASLCSIVLARTSYIWKINEARRRGIYPVRGKATIEDVKRLLVAGERFLANCVYREMYGLNYEQAQREIDLLERNLPKENFTE